MINPYKNLHIYYFDGILKASKKLQASKTFLGIWEDEDISFLFFSASSNEIVEKILKENQELSLIEKYEMTGEQWHGDKIDPYFVNNLCVYPPWNKPDSLDNNIKEILLDPGVVFGTGRHQTTEDCLDLLHRMCTRHTIQSVLDIGTGTGLLSLGAATLGCKKVMACDFNHLAVKTCLNNIKLNNFESRILAFQAKGEEIISIPCDLLVANIHYDVMQHIIENPSLFEKKYFILSGLLNSEAKKILDSLSKKNVRIIERRCLDGVWNTILCETTSRSTT